MKKKIVFFDADGTLWYPRETKRSKMPHWIYLGSNDRKKHCQQLEMIPTVIETLQKLKSLGVIVVILSTNPHPPEEANKILRERVRHFSLESYFDEIHATREYHASKGEFILRILDERKIEKAQALMIGDHYDWDYKSARNVGVDALLLESDYMSEHPKARAVEHKIQNAADLFQYIE